MSGITNVGAPSRYIAVRDKVSCTSCHTCVQACPVGALSVGEDDTVVYDSDRCIGCGHCASVCPEKGIRMALRQELPRLDPTNDALWSRIRREAMVGMVRDKLFPRTRS
ncbi:MAG: 4Fe-4S binding protein [Anaerolineales bacterium]|nr:4Fe-4S binding protein [Anaerolineales bacterium]